MKSANATSRAVSNVFKGMVAYFGVTQIKAFGEELFSVGKQISSLEKAYTEITGSAAAANKEFSFLRQTADDLGQNFYDLADSYKSIAAASRGTALEGQKARDIFVAVTKASASLGLSADATKGALTAIQQMMSKGKVSAEELRQQLGERLPGAFNLMAEALGVTTSELDKMLQEGKVLAEDALPKLSVVLSSRYSGAVSEAVRASNKFAEAWTDLKAAMASSGFLDSATTALKEITDALKDPNVKQGMSDFAKNLGIIVEKMAQLTKYAGLRSVTATFGQAAELSQKGLLDLVEFSRLSFLERQKMVDDILAKQKLLNSGIYTGKINSETPGYSTVYKPSSAASSSNNIATDIFDLKKLDKAAEDYFAEIEELETDLYASLNRSLAGADTDLERYFYDVDKYEDVLRERKALLQRYGKEYKDLWQTQAEDLDEVNSRALEGMAEGGKNMAGELENAFSGWAVSYASTLNDMLWESNLTFEGILESFAKMLTQMAIQKSMAGIFENISFGSLFTTSAHGNVFAGPGIGAFRNQIVSRPTVFPFASGIGLMGEAGSEAIMPLTRTSGGDLGVKATGMNPVINVTVKSDASQNATVTKTQSGSTVDIVVALVSSDIGGGGQIAKSIERRYAVSPSTRRS